MKLQIRRQFGVEFSNMAVFGTSYSLEFGNEVILGKIWSQGVAFGCRSFRSAVKEVAYPVSVRKGIGRCIAVKRKNKFSVVMNFSQSHLDSDSPAAAITVSKEEDDAVRGKDFRSLEISEVDNDKHDGDLIDGNGGNGTYNNGGRGRGGGGGGGGGEGGDDSRGDKEEEEFGPIMKFEEVMKEVESRGVALPSDMLEAAKSEGIRKLLLLRYLEMQVKLFIFPFCMTCLILGFIVLSTKRERDYLLLHLLPFLLN